MQQPLQITFHGIRHSDALEARIREEATRLERYFDQITGCHVTVEAPHQHHNKGNLYSVRVALHLPDRELVVGRERRHQQSHEDVYVALRDAFTATVRQLEQYADQRQRRADRQAGRVDAEVSRLFREKGYGFAKLADGEDVYFHANSVKGRGIAALKIGDRVRMVLAELDGEQGRHASAVVRLRRKNHRAAAQLEEAV